MQQEVSDYRYQQMPDIEVDYISVADRTGIYMPGGHPFICWQDMLIKSGIVCCGFLTALSNTKMAEKDITTFICS